MKRKMMQYDAAGDQALGQAILQAGHAPDKKKMFGHEVYFLNGYMFAGANTDGCFVHVGEEAVKAAVAGEPGVGPFCPMEGMTMKAYLQLTPAITADAGKLGAWLTRSAEYLMALPPKVKKPRKPRARNK
jgi:TfoX/Sxy family transcriptional regulator of competence genes